MLDVFYHIKNNFLRISFKNYYQAEPKSMSQALPTPPEWPTLLTSLSSNTLFLGC